MSTTHDIPVKGEVVRYRYLWKRDEDKHVRPKDVWPCLILRVAPVGDRYEVLVLPITNDPQPDTRWFTLLPLGRIAEAAHLVYTEANVCLWPSEDVVHVEDRQGRREPRPRVTDAMLHAADVAYRAQRQAGKALPIDRDVMLNQRLADYQRRRDERARQR